MTDSSHCALRLALSLADPAAADALAERLRPELLAALAYRFGLPEEAVERLVGAEPARMRAALTADPEEWLIRAAELGDPTVGRALWEARYRPGWDIPVSARDRLLPVILSAADPRDERWYEDGGLVEAIEDEADAPTLFFALTSTFPRLIGYATAMLGPYLPPPVMLDAAAAVAELTGGNGVASFVRGIETIPELGDLGHPWFLDVLRQAADAPDPVAFLRERRPAGEWTDPAHVRALLALRSGNGPTARPDGLDWELIRREHERLPFGQETGRTPDFRVGSRLLRLVRWEGCPADLVMDGFREAPEDTARSAELPFEALTMPSTANRWRLLADALGPGIRAGRLSAERVLAEVTPAEAVLVSLPYDHEPTRKALADLLGRLGTDPVNWLTCYARIGRTDGSVADLIADACSTDTRRTRRTSWPRPSAAQFPASPPENTRPAFLAMFQCASEEAQIAVVPHFDARAVQHLLIYGDPPPAVREAVVAAHGVPAQVAMAAAHGLGDEKLEYLLDLDEPAVDALLFHDPDLDPSERKRMLAGRLRGGGIRPVPGELLAVLDDLSVSHDRDWLLAGLESGDLGVARRIVDRVRLHVPASRLRLLAAVWERGGPDAVREILAMDRLPVTLRRRTEKLLDAPDGLERLRDRLAEEESPAKLLAYLSRSALHAEEQVHRLLGEGLEPPWSALAAAQKAGTLPAGLLGPLVELPDCPRELLLAALTSPAVPAIDWIHDAVKGGKLTPTDILTLKAPARDALDPLRRYGDSGPDAAARQPVRERAAALAREHLAADAEAWAVCLQLLPTFAGTLPELLATAGAVTRVHP
ncbi:hypothetical protein [Streptomyces chattanoogensis]|uniref:hypothetical protein n=1 Tax=Streptomyces chattanoogensis TaxID=66876 RepID=UPI0036AEAB27